MSLRAKQIRRNLCAILLLASFLATALIASPQKAAAAGVNQQLNFQGRLLNAQGATVPDGYYNIEFKIYQDGDGQSVGDTTGSPAGTLKWTEDYLNSNSQGVTIKNGYLSVQLGSINPFGSSIDWNQDKLWLSMNVAGTGTSCTPFASCSPDGEMLPMKRLSANAYALNAGLLNGFSSADFLQLAKGVQTDAAAGVDSIAINKTGAGNFVALQSSGTSVFTLSGAGDIAMGANADHTLSVATAAASTAGKALTISAGAAGSGGSALAGGNLVLQGGAGGGTNGAGGNITINAGAGNGSGAHGSVLIGSATTGTIQIGNTALSSGTQVINIGTNNTAGGTTDVTIGNDASAAAGATTVQAKDSVAVKTNGVTRATYTNTNTVYFGNGLTAGAPNNFTLSGTGSDTSGVNGASLTVQGGAATTGNADGGNLVLAGGTGSGTGANGLVVISTPTFSTAGADANCFTGGALVASSCTITQTSVNNSSAIVVGFSTAGQVVTLPAPTKVTAGRLLYITAANGSQDFILSVNGGGTGNEIAMRQSTSATMMWNGSEWTAAGASSSTTLQSAYDNTLQSAGGAELIVGHTANTNGLTIRDSAVNPVDGTLLSVQTSSAAGLLSVNSDVTEYSSDGGAETYEGTVSTFPSGTWASSRRRHRQPLHHRRQLHRHR